MDAGGPPWFQQRVACAAAPAFQLLLLLQHVKEMAQKGAEIAKEGLTMPTPTNIKEMVYGAPEK